MNFDAFKADLAALKSKLTTLGNRIKTLFPANDPMLEIHTLYSRALTEIHSKLDELHGFAVTVEDRIRAVERKLGIGKPAPSSTTPSTLSVSASSSASVADSGTPKK